MDAHNSDFTTAHYRDLLALAQRHYRFITYDQLPQTGKFILWRHDCDFSLNRALRLARLEHAEGIRATYFINPHSEFYNPLEAKQAALIREILALGHAIGLHFDAAYYAIRDEARLEALVMQEAEWLRAWFGAPVSAFSFHNPTPFLLGCERATYGGLVNCYAGYFKTQVGYCSDSNGYWRHRRLYDVLTAAADPCLQVLTHPGWWQENAMPPRERILRCAQGRADTAIADYDAFLHHHNRKNIG